MADEKKTVPADKPRDIEVDGVRVTVKPDIFEDIEVLDWLDDLQDIDGDGGNIFALPKLLHRLCEKDYEKVIDHLRGTDGRTSITKASQFITDLIGKANPNS